MDKDKLAESEIKQNLVVNEPSIDSNSVSVKTSSEAACGDGSAPQETTSEAILEATSEAILEAIPGAAPGESLHGENTALNQSTQFDRSSGRREPALIRVRNLKSRKEKKDQPPASQKRTRTFYVLIAIFTTVIGIVTVPVAWIAWTFLNYYFPQSPGVQFIKHPMQVGGMKSQDLRQREVQANQWRGRMRHMIAQIKKMPKPEATQIVTGYGDLKIKSDVMALLQNKKFGELTTVIENASKQRVQHRTGDEQIDILYEALANPGEVQDAAWKEHLALLEEWAKSEPTSAIPHVVLADFYIKYAWSARGSGWAKDVQPWQWDLFRDRLYLSAQQLQLALAFGTPGPQWFSVAQINILGAGQKSDRPIYDAITEIGNSLYPNYVPLYLNKVYYLQPRWRGTNQEWVDYATKTADAVGGEEGDKLYARMVANVADLYPDVYKEAAALSKDRVDRGNAQLNKQFGGANSRK